MDDFELKILQEENKRLKKEIKNHDICKNLCLVIRISVVFVIIFFAIVGAGALLSKIVNKSVESRVKVIELNKAVTPNLPI